MKHFFYLLIFSILINTAFSQEKRLEITHYLFPEFSKGVILLKSGERNETMLNFNSLTEEMVFEYNGTKLALTQLELIDTVYIQGRKFITQNNKFLELIYNSQYALFAEHKCNLVEPGKPAPFGGTSQTSSVTAYSSYLIEGQVYELKLPVGYKTRPFTYYWLKKDGNLNKFISLKQLSRLFSDKESQFKDYVKKHDVKYEHQENLIELIRFLDEN